MPVEFFGSLFVFATLALVGRVRNRWLVYAVLAGVLYLLRRLYTLDFRVGMALCDAFISYGSAVLRRPYTAPIADPQRSPVEPADAPAGVTPGDPGTELQFLWCVRVRSGPR